MSMEKFFFALDSQRERKQKQLCESDVSQDPHLHLLLNKSVAMTTSREPQTAWRLPVCAICFAPWASTQRIQVCIWLSHRQEYKHFLKPIFPQHGHSYSETTMAATDLSLTQVCQAYRLLFLLWLLTMAPTCPSLFSDFTLSPYPECPILGSQGLPWYSWSWLQPTSSDLWLPRPFCPYPSHPQLPPAPIHSLSLPITYFC